MIIARWRLWQVNIQRKLWWSHREQRTQEFNIFHVFFIRAAVCFGLLLLLIGLNRCQRCCHRVLSPSPRSVISFFRLLLFFSFSRQLCYGATDRHQSTMNAFSVYFLHSKLSHSIASHTRWPRWERHLLFFSFGWRFWLLDERTAEKMWIVSTRSQERDSLLACVECVYDDYSLGLILTQQHLVEFLFLPNPFRFSFLFSSFFLAMTNARAPRITLIKSFA